MVVKIPDGYGQGGVEKSGRLILSSLMVESGKSERGGEKK